MRKLLLIYNATAGKGKIVSALAAIIDVMTKAGWLVTTYPTQSRGDASLAATSLAPHFERVVCAGGDGTLSETVTGLMALDNPPVLGYIPLGSTNDCAVTLRLPKSPRKAAAIAAGDGVLRPIDVGMLNGRPFFYVAAFGAFTNVAYDTPQDLKNILGHAAYIIEGLASLPTIAPFHLKIEYDGQVIEDEFYFGMVRNALSVGGIKPPHSDQVKLDDGLFEVELVRKPISLAEVTTSVQSLIAQSPAGSLVHLQASHLVVTCAQHLPWTIDGEYGGNRKVNEITNRKKVLTVIQGA